MKRGNEKQRKITKKRDPDLFRIRILFIVVGSGSFTVIGSGTFTAVPDHLYCARIRNLYCGSGSSLLWSDPDHLYCGRIRILYCARIRNLYCGSGSSLLCSDPDHLYCGRIQIATLKKCSQKNQVDKLHQSCQSLRHFDLLFLFPHHLTLQNMGGGGGGWPRDSRQIRGGTKLDLKALKQRYICYRMGSGQRLEWTKVRMKKSLTFVLSFF